MDDEFGDLLKIVDQSTLKRESLGPSLTEVKAKPFPKLVSSQKSNLTIAPEVSKAHTALAEDSQPKSKVSISDPIHKPQDPPALGSANS